MPKRDLEYIEYRSEDTTKNDRWDRRTRIKESINAAAAALSEYRLDHERAAAIATDQLVPLLLGADEDRQLDELKRYREAFATERPDWDYLAAWAAVEGSLSPAQTESAIHALTAIAEDEGIVSPVSNHSQALGHSVQIGRLWSTFDWDHGEKVKLVSRNSGMPKTLFCGKTGQGKSATLDTEVEDRFNHGYKIVDLLDTDEFESAVYDIPQKQPDLRDAREEMNLPADFTESDDYDSPKVEIMVPLMPETEDLRIPVDDDGNTVVKPFTIPASDLDETTLVSFLSALLSKQQEASIRTAYDAASEADDWTLEDLAAEIRDSDDLGEKFKRRAIRLLENLQNKGVIRDQTNAHSIDWERIFSDTDTITAFSVAPLRDETDQLMVLSYLFNAVYYERKWSRSDLPPCAAVARELHEVVPHREETNDDDRVKALQKAIASNLSYVMKKNRHQQLELLFDTQDFMDLKKGVRKRFSRFVAFKMPTSTLKNVFQVAGEYGYEKAAKSIGVEKGEGAVIGVTEPNVTEEVPFLSPVKFAPASFHHFDVDEHNTGFEARVDYLGESMTTADWQGDLDEGLSFEVEALLGDESFNPYQKFTEQCLVTGEGLREPAGAVYDAYTNFVQERGIEPVGKSWFSRKYNEAVDDVALEQYNNGETIFYEDVSLNQAGNEYLPAGSGGGAPASAGD